MISSKVLTLETAGFRHRDCQGVAQDEHGGGTCRGSQIEWASLPSDSDREDKVGVLSQGGLRITGDGDQVGVESFQYGKKVGDFFGFAGIAEDEKEIAVVDQAEVAVKGIDGIEDHTGGAGACKGGGDFAADMPGFTDAEDDDFVATLDGLEDPIHGLDEPLVQLVFQAADRLQLDVNDSLCLCQIVHGIFQNEQVGENWQ